MSGKIVKLEGEQLVVEWTGKPSPEAMLEDIALAMEMVKGYPLNISFKYSRIRYPLTEATIIVRGRKNVK